MRIDSITTEVIDLLRFPGGPYNATCAPKNLRRMLHKAEEWGMLPKVPENQADEGIWPHWQAGCGRGAEIARRLLSVSSGEEVGR